MDLLLNNPIADLYGPYFLIVYALFVAGVLVGVRFWIAGHDATGELDPLPIPADPDPYEIAFLRGGVNELIRVVVFDLLQRGFLEHREERGTFGLTRKNKIAQAEPVPSRFDLTPIETRVLDHFVVPREAADVFKLGLPESLELECADYDRRLEDARLSRPREQKSAAIAALLFGGALILGLGGYKFIVALWKGHTNVAFLAIMGIASLAALGFLCRNRRVSRRGQRYLDDLRRAFERIKTRAAIDSAKTDGPSSELVLVCSLFGVSALASTPYAYYRDMFVRGGTCGAGVGSGCGGGCGGGGCGGGGCGGGCGGCGG
jgi:uncharacterized protein (TIGR04222 family)